MIQKHVLFCFVAKTVSMKHFTVRPKEISPKIQTFSSNNILKLFGQNVFQLLFFLIVLLGRQVRHFTI